MKHPAMHPAMWRLLIADTIFVRGVKGVKYFRKLYDNLDAWEARKAFLIKHTLDTFRLNIEKAKEVPEGATAFAPKIYDQEAGVIIERFYVETIPGYYLCGNLYVSADPAVNTRPMPLVLLAHGHYNRSWDNRDRFFEDNQRLGAAFAKQGFCVAAWDMVGHGDDRIDEKNAILKHYSRQNTVVQTWNSMRLLSYLLSERFTRESSYQVDAKYVAATGPSGGATQTLYLALLDSRVTAAMPAVMVSAWFNGDCMCENGINALHTRRCKSNIAERAACFAPKPLLVISDGDDWTRTTPEVEYPYLQGVYAYYGAQSKVENFHDLHGVHDYSLPKRQHALDFLLRQWGLPENGVYDLPYTEDCFVPKPVEEMKTFSAQSGLARPADYKRTVQALYESIENKR